MSDVATQLLAQDRVSPDTAWMVLSAINELGRRFDVRPRVSLCSLKDRYALFVPTSAAANVASVEMPSNLRRAVDLGWANLDQNLSPLVSSALREVVATPDAVSRVLSDTRATLVHGDLSPENVAVKGNTVTLLDWGTLTMWAPSCLDAAGVFISFPLPERDRENLLDHYTTSLKDSATRRAFEVGLLAEFSMVAAQLAFTAAESDSELAKEAASACLQWWDARLRESVAAWREIRQRRSMKH